MYTAIWAKPGCQLSGASSPHHLITWKQIGQELVASEKSD